MRKITLLFILIFSVFTTVKSQLLYSDDFSTYSVAALEGQNSWAVSLKGVDATGASPLIADQQLSYGTYIHSDQGKVIQSVTTTTARISAKSFGSAITSGSLYIGFMVKFTTVTGANTGAGLDFFGATFNNTGNTTLRGRVFVRKGTTANAVQLCITKGSTPAAAGTYWSGDIDLNSTHFLVIKYTIIGTGAVSGELNDTYRLFIDPVIGNSELLSTTFTDVFDATTVADASGLINFSIRQRGDDIKISGIRVGRTWEDVVKSSIATPQLTTPAVGSATSITANGFTAAWTQVANAVGYDVKVYLGANLVSTSNVSGQATESLELTGLMSGLTYTYKVIAKGNITNYSDSELSAASSNVSTLDPYASNTLNTDFNNEIWGTPVQSPSTNLPAYGSYPSSVTNGFILSSAVLYANSIKGLKGETHTNSIVLDKLTGKFTLPTLNLLSQIEIHAIAGTAGNGFQLKEFDQTTNTWNLIGSTNVTEAATKTAGTDSIYIFLLSRSIPSKFRIENIANGAVYLYQVITRTTNPTLLAKPTVSAASGISTTGFTANWTSVANSTAYKVFVYKGTTLIAGAPFTANGQATESLSIADLTAETAYSFKVQAIGDGSVSFSDSFLSFAGLVTTSIGTSLDELNTSNLAIVSGKKISLAQTGSVSIFNLQGAQVYQAKNVNSVNTNLATGLYILQFTNNAGKQLIQKISIK